MRNDRKKMWIDQFQTKLFIRIGVYMGFYLFCLGNLLFIWRLLEDGPGNPFYQYAQVMADNAPALICLLVLMPFLIYDAMQFSHRLVGPMVRFRRAMEAITRGEAIRPLKLREGDFLNEFRDDFNQMLLVLQKHGVQVLLPNDGAEESKERQTA
jgi:hypothetical protein